MNLNLTHLMFFVLEILCWLYAAQQIVFSLAETMSKLQDQNLQIINKTFNVLTVLYISHIAYQQLMPRSYVSMWCRF